MLRERPLGPDTKLKRQRQQFTKIRMIQGKLITPYWRTRIPKRLFSRWWLVSETLLVFLQAPTMERMGKMRMMTTQSRASWAKINNPAGWWAQSLKWCSSTWSGFDRCRWRLMNWHNQDARIQPTSSMKQIRFTAHLKWGFQQPFNCKQGMM